jgi:hypothetical protein
MAINTTTLRSRRTLLTAAVGGVGALAVQALGHPAAVRAADGDVVAIGGHFFADTDTIIEDNPSSPGSPGPILLCINTDATAIQGQSENATGVLGASNHSVGVSGIGEIAGVLGDSAGGVNAGGVRGTGRSGTPGVVGESDHAVGVRGHSEDSAGVLGHSAHGAGVVGEAITNYGVYGSSESYVGTYGTSPAGTGVFGNSASGSGVAGWTDNGIGVTAAVRDGGTALQAQGPVRFSTATLATIPVGATSVTVTPGIDLTADSKVLCTVQSDPGNRSIHYVVVNPSTNSYTVFLSGKAASPVTVACFVIS